MSPTPHLRWIDRGLELGFGYAGRRIVLQQLWREHHIPSGETTPKEEWRDVPLVDEEKG